MDYTPLYNALEAGNLCRWVSRLQKQIPAVLSPETHGDWALWMERLNQLPTIPNVLCRFDTDAVSLSSNEAVQPEMLDSLKQILMQLQPWRKGPFDLFGLFIDAEWRSDLKWNRLKGQIDLQDKCVLDVGSGNGYYGWRMLGAGAKLVIGIEPFLKNVAQYLSIVHFTGPQPFYTLPIGVQDMPENLNCFDSVFSMGVLYHRRSPFDHLLRLKSFLKPGGELILETLIIEGPADTILVPDDRYAKMRNVWFIPSVPTLQQWLKRSGFHDIQLLDVSATTSAEQRRTAWMTWESLDDYLNPADPSKTIEGYPAPRRAMLMAKRG